MNVLQIIYWSMLIVVAFLLIIISIMTLIEKSNGNKERLNLRIHREVLNYLNDIVKEFHDKLEENTKEEENK